MSTRLTAKQIALVHVARRELGLDDQAYRDILYVEAKVESSRDLDPRSMERVLNRFIDMGWSGPGHLVGGRRRRAEKARPGEAPAAPERDAAELPTPGQQSMLLHLWADVGWPPGERRQGFAQRMCGHPWPQTRAQANVLIEALKAMVKRGYSDRTPRASRG